MSRSSVWEFLFSAFYFIVSDVLVYWLFGVLPSPSGLTFFFNQCSCLIDFVPCVSRSVLFEELILDENLSASCLTFLCFSSLFSGSYYFEALFWSISSWWFFILYRLWFFQNNCFGVIIIAEWSEFKSNFLLFSWNLPTFYVLLKILKSMIFYISVWVSKGAFRLNENCITVFELFILS